MQQQPTYSAALANRSIPIVSRTPSAKCQLAAILKHDDVATRYTRRPARRRLARHLCNTYPFIAQKTREPNLLGPVPCKASNAGAWTSNEGRMQRRPPFSRRRSPNRPSATSIDIKPPSARPIPTRESVSTKLRNQKKMCAFDSRSQGRARNKPQNHCVRNVGMNRRTCGEFARVFFSHTRLRVRRGPGAPSALVPRGAWFRHNPGEIAPRECGFASDESKRAMLSFVIARHRVGATRRPVTGYDDFLWRAPTAA